MSIWNNATRYDFSTSDNMSLSYSISGYWTAFNYDTTFNGVAYSAGTIVNQDIFIDRPDGDPLGDIYYKYGLGSGEDTVFAVGNIASGYCADTNTYSYHVETTAYREAPADGISFHTLALDWSLIPPTNAILNTEVIVTNIDGQGFIVTDNDFIRGGAIGEIIDRLYQTYEINNLNLFDTTEFNPDSIITFTNTSVFATEVEITSFEPPPNTIVCFAKGSLIAAEQGSVAVEKLKVGDKVLTVTGKYETIKWVGHRRVNCNKHSRPTEAWPVKVSKDAFGAGMPNQDLYLSPAHSVYVYGHLVPITHLVNDVTIVQEQRPTVIYYHIELDHHSVIYAQGLPSETFLDSTNRKFFSTANSNVTNLADANEEFSEMAGRDKYLANCFAPFVTEGPVLEAIYEKLVGKPAYQAHASISEQMAA